MTWSFLRVKTCLYGYLDFYIEKKKRNQNAESKKIGFFDIGLINEYPKEILGPFYQKRRFSN
ncbi:hypothetical protein SAMN04487988_102143 [Algoriphagus hitonicola]|uniref:Uncharacterized protein n=1 Tax=Algoriphagus hitonicola TaxID=435880 RepID=A0A1I2Q727_9BACT|nr:hypothetical protein SAMN04487988_102143 [Algoriphagus hitonicola]